MNAIEIKNLSKKYTGFSLKDISFTLPSGYIMGLVGENGAGKTTIIKLILDMIKRDNGTITVLGKDNKDHFEFTKQDIGVVLDEIGISGFLKANQIDKIMKNIFTNWYSDVFYNYLKKLSVPTDKKFKEFSKGMKMKMGIAIALSHQPKLLILDEATSGLDPVVRDEFTDILSDFTRDENHSVLISSHIVSDLEKVCDYITFIHSGELILCEEKDRLYEKYCIVQCSESDLYKIDSSAIISKKISPYGAEAVAEKSKLPSDLKTMPVDIERLFISMTRR